jgi:hypothetical protein
VLQQPHRRGAKNPASTRRDDVFGRFCDDQRLHDRIWRAGNEYWTILNSWRKAKGIPTPNHLNAGTGQGPSSKTVQQWEDTLSGVRAELRSASSAHYVAMRSLIDDGQSVPPDLEQITIDALRIMAVYLDFMGAKDHPYAGGGA